MKPIQDIIIEIQYRDLDKSIAVSKSGNASRQRAIFVGWTGMQSQGRPASSLNKGSGKSTLGPVAENAVVEIDATFGRMLGLAEGQKVVYSIFLANNLERLHRLVFSLIWIPLWYTQSTLNP